MKEYLINLIEQYCDAIGVKNVDVNSKTFISELCDWVDSRVSIANEYTSLLKEMNINFNNKNCAEIGKGCFDSAVLNCNTTIITPYTNGFREKCDNMVVTSSFYVDNGKPVFSAYKRGTLKVLLLDSIKTYMIQNPYSNLCISDWEFLVNNGIDIVVGIYGSIYDKDISKKINQMQELKSKLSYCTNDYSINNDSYCYVLTSKKSSL